VGTQGRWKSILLREHVGKAVIFKLDFEAWQVSTGLLGRREGRIKKLMGREGLRWTGR
jgi:hypothetical protein